MQGVDDLGSGRISFRSLPEVFRADTGFEHVYEAPDGRFYRMAGGLVAVFDRSEYVPTRSGAAPVIPADTVFHIGPPGWMDQIPPIGEAPASSSNTAERATPASVRLAERVRLEPASSERTAVRSKATQTSVPASPAPASIGETMSDETTRQRRLREIAAAVASR